MRGAGGSKVSILLESIGMYEKRSDVMSFGIDHESTHSNRIKR